MDTVILGVAGKARSGKDTVAEIVQKHYGWDIRAFAEPIRTATMHILMLGPNHMENHKEEDLTWVDTSYRDFAQKLGTELARDMIDQEFWIKRMQQSLIMEPSKFLVISDVRFEDEATWIRSSGGTILHLERPDIKKVKDHVSENGIARLKGETVIINNGTLAQLETKVVHFMMEEYE